MLRCGSDWFRFFFIDLLAAFDCGFIYGGRKHASESHANLCLAPCSQSYAGRIFCIFRPHWDISRTIGPFLGGMIFIKFGGAALFLAIAGIMALGGIAQYRAVSRLKKLVLYSTWY